MRASKGRSKFIIRAFVAGVLLLISLVVSKGFSLLAQGDNQGGAVPAEMSTTWGFSFENLTCDSKYITRQFVDTVTIVPLFNNLVEIPGVKRQRLESAVLYELTVKRNLSALRFNGWIVDGKLRSFYCDKPDAVLKGNEKYGIVLALLDNSPATYQSLKEVVDNYKVSRVQVSRLLIKDNEAKLSEAVECTAPWCEDLPLYEAIFAARNYKVSITDISYPAEVINPQVVSISFTVENNSEFVIPSAEVTTLELREISPTRVAQLYSSDWVDLKIVSVVNQEPIIPGQKRKVEFKVGPYLKPGVYSGRFALFLAGEQVPGTQFEVVINFKKGDYQLGVINSQGFRAVNLRSAPDLNAAVVTKLLNGDYVIWLEQQGAWVKVRTASGQEGWVYRRFILRYVE